MTTKEMIFFPWDIETLQELFIFGGKTRGPNPVVHTFIISQWRNDLYKLVKFIEETKDWWYVGFNSYSFDTQVMEWILRNYQGWHDLSNLEICAKIAQYAQDCIDDSNYDLQPRFKYWMFSFKNIDLFRVWHFDNLNNRTSLKWLEFRMNMPNVSEMPIHHTRKDLTQEEVDLTITYWINDLDATNAFLDVTLGETEWELFKGKDKIQDRLEAIEEFKFPQECLQWSDVKIGEQINLKTYCSLTGKTPEQVYELKRRRKPTKAFTFGQCIPDYVQFQTPELRGFYEKMKKVRVNLRQKEEFPFRFRGTTYMIAKGGIHSEDPKRVLRSTADVEYVDADVPSQYPGAIEKRGLYPSHLGPEWLVGYGNTKSRRIADKPKSEDLTLPAALRTKFKGIVEMLKLALNGGGFGMTNQDDSWQYDPFVTFSCTIGNEFEMLMWIEALELNGIHCVSANTDGIVCAIPRGFREKYDQICREWEAKVKIVDKLEYTEFEALIQESVNHYIGVKKGGKLKLKGRMSDDSLLNKNPTKDITYIQRTAIQQYFSKGIPVEKTIRECQDIFKFVFGFKSGAYHFVTQNSRGETTELKKLVRLYASVEGVKIIKVKNEDTDTRGAKTMKLLQTTPVTIFNESWQCPMPEYRINYEFYERGAWSVIREIEAATLVPGKKLKKQEPVNPNQTALF